MLHFSPHHQNQITMNYSELKVAKKAALAGEKIIRFHEHNRDKLTIEYKGLHDLVTQADVETEKAILEVIREHFPNDHILAEESGGTPELKERTWIVDPIDGTTNFAHGFPNYCISIAFYKDGTPSAGLVFNVPVDELFTAEAGKGAYLNDKPIKVGPARIAGEALIATGFPYRDLSVLDDYMKVMMKVIRETQSIRRPGSAAYDLACVAAGRFDGFWEYALSAWDVAAGALLIREAGGTISDWNGGEGWLFGKRLVAGNPAIHHYLLDSIQQLVSEENRANIPT